MTPIDEIEEIQVNLMLDVTEIGLVLDKENFELCSAWLADLNKGLRDISIKIKAIKAGQEELINACAYVLEKAGKE